MQAHRWIDRERETGKEREKSEGRHTGNAECVHAFSGYTHVLTRERDRQTGPHTDR